MSTSSAPAEPTILRLGGYRGLVSGDDADFQQGGLPTPDGGFWAFREPDAVVVVEHDHLRVHVEQLTRRHDEVQFFDNAKHMYYSKRSVVVPEAGEVTVEIALRARVHRGRDDDLYSGFVSFNVLDLSTGLAIDWFLSNRRAATVYAVLPFPGAAPPPEPEPETTRPRYFCVFHEVDQALVPGEEHRCGIAYSRSAGTVRFLLDGEEVDRYEKVPVAMESFLVALGMMTEKPIGDSGSVSCFGQGITADYSEVLIEGAAGLR